MENFSETDSQGSQESSLAKLRKRNKTPASCDEVKIASLRSHDQRKPPTGNENGIPPSPPRLIKDRPGGRVRGLTSTNHLEKAPSIEDAVYIYAALRNSGKRPPIFLQRNLVYLHQSKQRRRRRTVNLDDMINNLSSNAVLCQQIKYSLTSLSNVSMGSVPEKSELLVKFYVQKNCFKRRKTDVTVKERLVYSATIRPPLALDSEKHSFVLDINEICSSLGSHHLAACYLKGQFIFNTEKHRTQPIASTARRSKRRALVSGDSDQRFKSETYTCSLLLYASGEGHFDNSTHTLLLQSTTKSKANVSMMALDQLDKLPQLQLDTTQLCEKRSKRSPYKIPSPQNLHMQKASIQQVHQVNGLPEDGLTSKNPSDKVYIVMQYKGSHQTTVQTGFNCPFCLKKTHPATLIFLLKHLRLCHDRLLFLYKETDSSILVTVNTVFDGSYCGNPLDTVSSNHHQDILEGTSLKNEPKRRTPYTEVINIRCNTKRVTLEEFTKPEPITSVYNTSLMGHNRLYYHSVSNQPVLPNDFVYDSDGDDVDWTRIASSRLIDEFIDVNKGEKEMMKLWNQFISRNPQVISDRQMERACLQFVEEQPVSLLSRLRNNFLCHLATLYDCGILSPQSIKEIVSALPGKAGHTSTNGFHYV